MEGNRLKPLSPAAEIANLAINLNEMDFDNDDHGSSNQKQDENLEKPQRRRIALLPSGSKIGMQESQSSKDQSS